jgi:WD40 repeat protein
MTMITGPAPQAPRAVDPQNPWPGLAAFEEGDQEFFKGRDAEVDALLRTILREDLTLFSSVSGLGKTSLLRAGLFPKLRSADLFPVYVRLRYDASAPPLAEQCFDAIRQAGGRWGYEVPADAPSKTIWEYVRRHNERFWSPADRMVTPILVFDQFEELFTQGQDKAAPAGLLDRFFTDLSQALTGSPPAWLLAMNERTAEQHDYIYRPGIFKVLLSFREDYFAHVAGFRTMVGAIAHNHFRLGAMSFEQALAVVADAGGHLFDEHSRGGKKAVCERIVAEVAAAPTPAARTTATIDPALLSLFCRELNDKRQSKHQPLIDLDLVESAEASRIIGDFYDSCMKQVSDAARRFVEERLVLPESRTRESLAEEAATAAHVTEDDIRFLIDKRILHRDEATRRGQSRLELTHDVLVAPALAARQRRTIEEQRAEAERHAATLQQREREEQERARQAIDLAAAQERVALLEQVNAARDRAEQEARARRDAERQREAAIGRRNRTSIAALAMALVAMAAGGAVAWQQSQERARQLLATRLERAVDDAAGERPAQALARFAEVMRTDPANITARSLALDLLLGRAWLLPVASIDPGVSRATLEFNVRGNVIATAGDSDAVRLWDVDTGREIGSVVHKPSVASVRFGADDRVFVTVGVDGTAMLWDTETRTLISSLEHTTPVTAVAFRPGADGAGLPLVATRSADGNVWLWARQEAAVSRTALSAAGDFDQIEFSPDGLRILTTTSAGVLVWDSRTRIQIRGMSPPGGLTVAHFAPDGRTLVTGSGSGALRLWDIASGVQVAEAQCGRPINGIAFDRTGKRILTIVAPLSSTEPTASVWSVGEPSEAAPAEPRTLDRVTVLRSSDPDVDGFFADERTVVMMTRGDTASRSGRVRLSDARSGLPVVAPLPVDVTAIRVNRSGRRVVVAGSDGRVGVWTLRTPIPSIDLRARGPILQARFSRDGARVLTASLDRTAAVWDVATQNVVRLLEPALPVLSAEYSEDETLILTNSGGSLHVWDAASGDLRRTITATTGDFISARLNPKATAVVTASLTAPAQIWDVSSGEIIRELKDTAGLWYAEFSPGGDRIVTASRDGHADVWDARSGEHLRGPLMHAGPVVDARFSGDGSRIATASNDGTARVWSIDSVTPLAELRHLAAVNSVQFARSAADVITTSNDGTARIWSLDGAATRGVALAHDAPVDSAQVDASGHRLLTISSKAGNVRLWNLDTGLPLSRPILLPGAVWFAQFSPDGQRIVTAGADGLARVIPVPYGGAGDAVDWLPSLAEAVGGYTIDATGALAEVADRGSRLATFRMEAAERRDPGASFRHRFMQWFFLDTPGIL